MTGVCARESPNENSTAIRIKHRARGWRGEIATHYDSSECACGPDVLIEYTDTYGVRRVIRLVRNYRGT